VQGGREGGSNKQGGGHLGGGKNAGPPERRRKLSAEKGCPKKQRGCVGRRPAGFWGGKKVRKRKSGSTSGARGTTLIRGGGKDGLWPARGKKQDGGKKKQKGVCDKKTEKRFDENTGRV